MRVKFIYNNLLFAKQVFLTVYYKHTHLHICWQFANLSVPMKPRSETWCCFFCVNPWPTLYQIWILKSFWCGLYNARIKRRWFYERRALHTQKGVKAENISHAGDLTVISGTLILYPGWEQAFWVPSTLRMVLDSSDICFYESLRKEMGRCIVT